MVPSFKKTILDIVSLAQADPHVTEDSWVLFDIDNTLFEATHYSGHIHYIDAQREFLQAQGMSFDEVSKTMRPHWIQAHIDCPVRPVEPSTPEWVRRFQEKSTYVFGLTHRYTDPELIDTTIRQLSEIGVDLSLKAPGGAHLPTCIEKLPAHALYHSGIIFADENEKGEALSAFLAAFDLKPPRHLVFIEDKVGNIKNLKKHVHCDFTGLHYTAVERDPVISYEEIRAQVVKAHSFSSHQS